MKRSDFSADFLWGAATAAYQIEGAALEDGRSACIWDQFATIPGATRDGHSGAVACDHYHRLDEDLDLLQALGVNTYRFSISWSRVMPSGQATLNPAGVAFYNRLIDGLLARGIQPAATLYHWDLPQQLQDQGGWVARDSVAWFEAYAKAMFDCFADRVKIWFTHNEPWVVAWAGHYIGRHAPGMTDLNAAVRVTHHLNLSHAHAVAAYRQHPQGNGKIGAVLNLYPMVPASEAAEDHAAARRADGYHNRLFLDPVLLGNYPADTAAILAQANAALPIEAGDLAALAAARSDFLGVNYYFRKVVLAGDAHPVFRFAETKPPGAPYTAMDWEVWPDGLVDLLRRLRTDYGDMPILITENGAAFADETIIGDVVQDEDRREFVATHLEAALRAVHEGIPLQGYYYWSLLDNFEWAHGYHKRFGLFRVDYATQKRSWKSSGQWYRDFLRSPAKD
ncbi:MAG: beta-glucosidase [Uliginosibacterium sp.]|nr:beta-glucosidase [Uliginosibacterium sp.]